MKVIVNGQETDWDASDAVVMRLHDRLMVRVSDRRSHSALAVRHGEKTLISYQGRQYVVEKAGAKRPGTLDPSHGEALAPMPGAIVDVRAAVGESVVKGQTLLVLEAMKTQQPVQAPFDGVIISLPVVIGQQVQEGDILVHVVSSSDSKE